AVRPRRLLDPRGVRRRRDRRALRDGPAYGHRLLGPRHDRRVRPDPRERAPARDQLPRRDGQLQPRADDRPVGEHLTDGHVHVARARALRWRVDPQLRPRTPVGRPQRHLLLDLQRQPAAGVVGERGDPAPVRPIPRSIPAAGCAWSI
ncbi:MAG: Protein translocase subunit SecF, partial [uncultured Thermomicrobiales bacterium]